MSLLILSSCIFSRGREPEIDYAPVKIVMGEDWCMTDADGRLRYEGELSGIEVSPVVNSYFYIVDSIGEVKIYRATSTLSPVNGLQRLVNAGYMAEGLIPVFGRDGALRVVDGFGRKRFSLTKDCGLRIVACAPHFSEGLLAIANERGQWGAVDREGNIIVPLIYNSCFRFDGGYALVHDSRGTLCRGYIIDRTGKRVLEFRQGTVVTSVHGGEIGFISDSMCSILNVEGILTRLPSNVCGIDDFNDTYIIYSDANGYRGLMRRDGAVVLRPRYNSLEFGDANDLLLASNAQRYFLMDYSGNTVSDFDGADEVVSICRRSGGLAGRFGYAARFGTLWSLYDHRGKRHGRYEYVAIGENLLRGLAVVTSQPRSIGHGVEGVELLDEFPDEFVADSVSAVPDTLIY